MPKKKTKENPKEQLEVSSGWRGEIGADADKDGDEVMKRLAQQKRRPATKPE